jgi:hypothetical protein
MAGPSGGSNSALVTCPSCGSATAENSKFCQNCGAALSPQPSAAAAGSAPSVAPTPMQSKSRRWTKPLLIAGAAVGALIVVGFVIHLLRPPLPACGCGPPVTTPSPGSGRTIETDRIAVVVSSDWQVITTAPDAIQIKNPQGVLTFGASSLPQPQTPSQLLQADLANEQKVDPNAKFCEGPEARAIPNGPANGQAAAICLLYTAQGQSFQATELWWEGVNANASIDFAIEVFTPPANVSVFAPQAVAVISTVRWKQYQRPAPPGPASAPPVSSNSSIVLQGSGVQDSPLLTTDDSLYMVTWQATNLIPDAEMPELPCGLDIVYFKGGGAGAENGGGVFGSTTLRTDSSNGPGPADVSGSTTFRPHPGQGYLEVNACARAQYVVTMERVP